MSSKKEKLYIVGAGISGLIAAKKMEDNGYSPIILEAGDSVGGRVQSFEHDGFLLDVGFQVLLDEYPYAKKYLDYEGLNLQRYRPGSVLFEGGKMRLIGDPMRDTKFLFSSLFSGVGSIKDKIKILRLNRTLKSKSLQEIFELREVSTLNYLQELEFSNDIIERFFKPFFSGIFLEDKLETSSRMFEFVYKMLCEGYATRPANGMQAIPNQLFEQLTNTEVRLNTEVKYVRDGRIVLSSGDEIESEGTVIATGLGNLIENMQNQDADWLSCETLYFYCANQVFDTNLIGLITSADCLVNNLVYAPSKKEGKNSMLVVTIVKKHKMNEVDLIKQVAFELKRECGIEVGEFFKRINIEKALPRLNDLRYTIEPSESQLMSTVFLAGDQLLNGSLNAAMISGERAAEGLIEKLEGNFGL